jgi:hypothetical protein
MGKVITVRRIFSGRVYERHVRGGEIVSDEACRLLGRTRRMLTHYIHRGLLHPRKVHARCLVFSLREVLALREKQNTLFRLND